jgi:hypothetical protein
MSVSVCVCVCVCVCVFVVCSGEAYARRRTTEAKPSHGKVREPGIRIHNYRHTHTHTYTRTHTLKECKLSK